MKLIKRSMKTKVGKGIVLLMVGLVFSFNLLSTSVASIDPYYITQLSDNENIDDDYPQIHNGMVTWMGFDGNDWEIFLYDGGLPIQLTNNNHDDANPQIHNGMVTWEGYDGNDREIFLYDGGQTIQLTDNDYYDINPQIHNGMVTWQGSEGYKWESVLYDGGLPIR